MSNERELTELKLNQWQYPAVIPPQITRRYDGAPIWYADGRRLYDRLAKAAGVSI